MFGYQDLSRLSLVSSFFNYYKNFILQKRIFHVPNDFKQLKKALRVLHVLQNIVQHVLVVNDEDHQKKQKNPFVIKLSKGKHLVSGRLELNSDNIMLEGDASSSSSSSSSSSASSIVGRIWISSGRRNITIKNVSICHPEIGSGVGIDVRNHGTCIHLQDVHISQCSTGLHVSDYGTLLFLFNLLSIVFLCEYCCNIKILIYTTTSGLFFFFFF